MIQLTIISILVFYNCLFQVSCVIFTGNVENDFSNTNSFVYVDGGVFDVGRPSQLQNNTGFDVKDIRFRLVNNALEIGINCFGICGDADGNGDDTSHEDLTNLGGEDFPFFGNSEAMLAFFDFNLDSEFEFDFVVGYPGQIPYGDVGKTKPKNIDGFGVYRYQFYPNQSPTGTLLLNNNDHLIINAPNGNWRNWAFDHNPVPNAEHPDVEWTILSLSTLLNETYANDLEFNFKIYSGSFMDAGIGEDFIPSTGSIKAAVSLIDREPVDDRVSASPFDVSSTSTVATTTSDVSPATITQASMSTRVSTTNTPVTSETLETVPVQITPTTTVTSVLEGHPATSRVVAEISCAWKSSSFELVALIIVLVAITF